MRIQLSRKKGWRKPEGTVNCARPGPFGNLFTIGLNVCGGQGESFWCKKIETNADAVAAFENLLTIANRAYPSGDEISAALAGKNLACWCHLCDSHKDGKPLDEECADCAPCHVDPLGRLANADLVAA